MKKQKSIDVDLMQRFLIVFLLTAYIVGPVIYYLSEMAAIEREKREYLILTPSQIAQRELIIRRKKVDPIKLLQEKLAPAPEAVKNVVLIRNERFREKMIQGYYYLQKNGRSFIIGFPSFQRSYFEGHKSFFKLSKEFDDQTKFEIVFHPQKPEQHIVLAKYLTHGEGYYYFEALEPLPPPVKVDWRQSDYKRIEYANLYGYRWASHYSEEEKPFKSYGEVVRAKTSMNEGDAGESREETELQRVVDIFPGGSLVCDELGVPFGLLFNKFLGKVFYFSELDQEVGTLKVTASLEPMKIGIDRHAFRTKLTYPNSLQLKDQVEFLIGTLNQLKPNLDLTNRTHFDQPVAEGMQVVQLQPVESEDKNLKEWTGVFAGSRKDDQSTHFVVQAHVKLKDGTDYYTFPQLEQGSKVSLVKQESNDWTPYAPGVDETEVPLTSSSSGMTQLPDLSPPVGEVEDADVVLNDVVWSADGKHVYLLTQMGRLHMIRLADRTQVRSIDLFRWCVDIDYSHSGLVVLGQQMLLVLDPETLNVKHEIPFPDGHFVATGTKSTVAYVATPDSLWSVNLETGEKNEATILKRDDSPLPDDRFTGMEMTEDGQTLILSDASRLHRCQPKPDGSLQHAESSLPLGRGLRMMFQQGDRRVALIVPRGDKTCISHFQESLPKLAVPTSSNTHNNLVFDVDDLTTPRAAISDQTVFIPQSGGMLDLPGNNYNFRFLRDNGEQVIDFGSTFGRQGSADPHSGRILLLDSRRSRNKKQVLDYLPPEDYTAPGSLKKLEGPPLEVVSVDKKIPRETREAGVWDISRLDIELEDDEALEKQSAAGVEDNPIVDSVAYSNQKRIAHVLTRDGVLHHIEFPSGHEFRKVKIAGATGLLESRLGLILDYKEKSEVLIIGKKSLQLKWRVPIAARKFMTVSPGSSVLWYVREAPHDSESDPDWFTVHAFDLMTGKEKLVFDKGDFGKSVAAAGLKLKGLQPDIKRIRQFEIMPNGKVLLVASEEGIYRFAVNHDELTFEDALPNLTPDAFPKPSFILSDFGSYLVANNITIPWRKYYPEKLTKNEKYSYLFRVEDFDLLEAKYNTEAKLGINVLVLSLLRAYSFDTEKGFRVYQSDGTLTETNTEFPIEQGQKFYGTRSSDFLLSGSAVYCISKSNR